MSYKPDERDWMAYLYDEMDEAERRKFEEFLVANPLAAEEFEKLRNLRAVLARAEDKEVIAPPLVIGGAAPQRTSRHLLWESRWVRAAATLAACIVVVILTGRFTGAEVNVSNREFRLSFGTPERDRAETPTSASSLSPAEVQEMIRVALERNNTVVRGNLQEAQDKLDASIRKSLAANSQKVDQLLRQASLSSQEQIRQYVDAIRTENMEQVKDYFQLTSTEQKQYIENLLVDYSAYLQQQRNNDLQLVQTWINSLEQNTDLFKQETEQMLTSIMTTVGAPASGENRN